MSYNLHKLGSLLPIYGTNNIIVDSRVIKLIFPPTTFIVVVSVINPTYHIWKLLINKSTTTKHTKGHEYPLGGQVVNSLDLTR